MSAPAARFLRIHPADNVMVALQDLPAATVVRFENQVLVLPEAIPAKHKFFLHEMAPGAEVTMYGGLVGKAQVHIAQGGRMTTANTAHAADPYAYRGWQQGPWVAPDAARFAGRTFQGYHRADGRVGTANYWLFVPLVFCENRNLDAIKEALHHELGYATTGKYRLFAHDLLRAYQQGDDGQGIQLAPASTPARARVFPNVDGIKFLNHSGGCGGTRQDADTLGELLAAYADHPNVAGVTVLSLGCQHLQTSNFRASLQRRNPQFDKPLLVFEQQLMDSEEQVVSEAIRQTFRGLARANENVRRPAPLSALSIGVKCGGSDGFSGLSANPAVGYAADLLVGLGGQVLLAEFPELCGAEQNILDRCPDGALAGRFTQLMGDYDALATAVGSGFFMNPSPGNIADGLITDAIKSAGAAKKGGTSPVADVLDYTEPARRPGLSLVCTPGNDVEATTGQAAAGATLILFTTGLGTPTGNPVCPVIKVATNTGLARRLADIIDLDAGPVIAGTKTIEQMGEEILDYCVRAASGEVIPKAVALGQDDFIPWKRGVSL
ncbi:UxaA family hydrolase [Hymenobacter nivis]|uniref:Altronate dehydratase n=1 Tax=Hymenobacter nivis TaxID=1850093 RepID=A0A502HF63_9BACT|nr:altronate dehydratase family protein [Hymenobacter nivis]TPG71860.1 altronate dehydratase [Hymenobacter nivis]